MATFRFSCIVPAYAEERFIGQTLRSIKNQTFQDRELVVVVRRSGDRTEEVASRYADELVLQTEPGLGEARNLGALRARGEVLVFIDADTVVPPDFLRKVDEILRDGRVVAVVPRFCVYDGRLKGRVVQSMLDVLIRVVNKFKFLMYGMLIVIRRDVLLGMGGFRSTFGEDVDLSFRLGKRYRVNRNRIVRYCRELVAYTSSRRIYELGFWRGLGIWVANLIRRWVAHRSFVGYLK